MATLISHSPADTEALGEKFGRAAQRGWVIALSGELGAGKTQFVKGVARGLDWISARIHFADLHAGGGIRWRDGSRCFILDLYRLENDGQILSAGLEEFCSLTAWR